jgi:fructokinase
MNTKKDSANSKSISSGLRVVGIGELLWDIFPDEKRPGGAPANVVYHTSLLGADSYLVSRVGNDQAGKEIVSYLGKKGINTEFIQTDMNQPTGMVNISFTKSGEPDYTIVKPVAWDFIEYSRNLEILVKSCDAIVFGTLAQRHRVSAGTIQKALKNLGDEILKVLDVNFRRDGYSADIVKNSLSLADIVKINEDEFNELFHLLESDDPIDKMLNEFGVRGICMTKGTKGSTWYDQNSSFEQKAYVADDPQGDPVGLGDGFTAVLTCGLLKNQNPSETLDKASRYTALLASKKGGMPELEESELSDIFK